MRFSLDIRGADVVSEKAFAGDFFRLVLVKVKE